VYSQVLGLALAAHLQLAQITSPLMNGFVKALELFGFAPASCPLSTMLRQEVSIDVSVSPAWLLAVGDGAELLRVPV
jgi:hypothetical protein